MEARSLSHHEWVEDTENLRHFLWETIDGALPDKVVGIAFLDPELPTRNDGSVDAFGLIPDLSRDASSAWSVASGVLILDWSYRRHAEAPDGWRAGTKAESQDF